MSVGIVITKYIFTALVSIVSISASQGGRFSNTE